jgi:hypothetical protein
MNKIFMILVRWNAPHMPNVEALQAQMERISGEVSWLRFTQFGWLLKTTPSVTSQQIFLGIKTNEAGIESVLITEVVRETKWGWCAQWIWDWIEKD